MTAIFSSIGSGVTYLAVYAICVAATAVMAGALFSAIASLTLKGKPDVDMNGVGGFFSGAIIGGLISLFLTAYLLFTTAALSTFMTTLGLCACILVACLVVLYLNWHLYGRR